MHSYLDRRTVTDKLQDSAAGVEHLVEVAAVEEVVLQDVAAAVVAAVEEVEEVDVKEGECERV